MLIVCRTKAPRRELTVIGSQYHRVRRVEMPVKMGCSRRSASPWLVLPGMRSAVETESAVKKMLAGGDRGSVGAGFTESGLIVLLQVAQLVEDDVVNALDRRLNQMGVEQHVASG